MTLSDYAQAFRAAQKRDAQSSLHTRQHQIAVIVALKADPDSHAHTLSQLAPLVSVPLKNLQQYDYIARCLPAGWASRYSSLSFSHLLTAVQARRKFTQAPYNTPSYWLDQSLQEHWTQPQLIAAIRSQRATTESDSARTSIPEVTATVTRGRPRKCDAYSMDSAQEVAATVTPLAKTSTPEALAESSSPPVNPRIARVIALAEEAESLQQQLAQALAEFNTHWAPYYGAQFTLQEEPLPFVHGR